MTHVELLEEELQKLEVKYISMILEYRKEKRLIFEKAKETLYTEEQVLGFSKWADDCGYMYNGSANCWYTQDGYKRTDEEMIWMYEQSLKQPKKD